MKPTSVKAINIDLLETLLSMGEYKKNDPVTPILESYKSLSQEIDKHNTWGPIAVGDAVHYHREDLLRKLYPMEHAKIIASGIHKTPNDVYNTLTDLLYTGLGTLPSIKSVPENSLLQFSDFTEIDHTAHTLTMPMILFNKKKLKFISFDRSDVGMKDYTRVLFVESTEQHKGNAIPFMLVQAPPGNYQERFQSPRMFNNNTTSWTIKIMT